MPQAQIDTMLSVSKVTKGTPGVPVYKTFPIDDLMSNDPRHQFRASAKVTLDNPVSAIINRRNMGNMNFDTILPSLQLVTLLLETPCLMGYYSGICLSVPRTVKYYDKPGEYKAIFRKPEPLSAEDVAGIKKFFAALAPYIQFEHGELPDTTNGTTQGEGPPIPGGTFAIGSIGGRSRIRINTRIYKELLIAIMAYEHDPESSIAQESLFTNYFHLAHILGHEIAHAVRSARWGDPRVFSFPFENRAFSEDGFDWESTVFSGILAPNLQPSKPEYGFKEWPCGSTIEHYLRKGATDIAITTSLQSLTSTQSCPLWRIAPCVLRAFFQKDFWASVVPKMGSAALRPPKLLGVRVAPVSIGKCFSCNCDSCFWMKEYALRAYDRGNGRIAEVGSRRDELVQLELARLEAERMVGGGGGSDRAEDQVRLASLAKRTPEHTKPSESCVRHEGWRVWLGPKSPADKRDIHTFGVPLFFKSHSDGTLVTAKDFDCIEAFEAGYYY